MTAGALLAAGACSDETSATDLNTDGPPMVRQVFVQEKQRLSEDVFREQFGLAFGDHPDIPLPSEDSASGDDREVDNALAFGPSVRIRVVVDELLRGNDLEEIRCNDESYSRVAYGADPDDIDRCFGPDLSDCEAVCAGVGIWDINGDGAFDEEEGKAFRMIDYGDGELGVSIVCDGVRVPLAAVGRSRTFYNPSGNQQIPAATGVDGLGPALVIRPDAATGLRTGSTCTVQFRPEVVDKDGNSVCAPPGGDVTEDCPGDSDTSAIQFQVEPLAFSTTTPRDGAVLPLATPTIQLEFVAPIDMATLGAITLSSGGADLPIEVVLVEEGEFDRFRVEPVDPLAPETAYTITVGTDLADLLGGTPPEPLTIHFTTSPGDAP